MAVLIRTRRLANPSHGLSIRKTKKRLKSRGHFSTAVRKSLTRMAKTRKAKNPAKKLSLAQKLHFGTARQRAAARLKLANPSRRRTKKATTKAILGRLSKKFPIKKARRSLKDIKRSLRKTPRRKNVGEIVSISLAGLNPGRKKRLSNPSYYVSYYSNNGYGPIAQKGTYGTKREAQIAAKQIKSVQPGASPLVYKSTGRRKNTVAKRRARRRNYGTVVGRSFSHTKVGKRRKKNPGVRRRRRASSHRHVAHRRRRNPLYRMHRVRRHRNPGIGGVTTGVIGKAFAVIAGAIGSKYVTQLALGGNNTGYMGYGANLVASIGLGWAAGKVFKSKDIGTSVMIGGIAGLALRVLQDMTSIGQYVNLSLAGAGKGGDLGLGIIENSSFPVPQVAAPGSMTSFLTPRNTRDYVSSQMAQAAQMASTAKPGMGRMMGGRAPRRAIM